MPQPFGYAKRVINANRKTNNHSVALPAKVEIRERVMAAIGGPERAVVWDGYAGEGQLYRRVWHRARGYAGCDQTWYRDDRLLYVADTRRVMRVIDLSEFTVFDFDPWGSPWEPVIILCARRAVAPGERLGLCLTEGSALKVKMGKLPTGLARLVNWPPGTPVVQMMLDDIITSAIGEVTRRLNCRLVHRWQAHGKTAARVLYIGLVLEGRQVPC